MRKKRIYIVPTRFGLVFLIGACIMLFVGATYQNNLVNLLAFFMLSLIFVAMVQTHNNLKDVVVEAVEADPGFAGKDFLVTTILRNSSRETRYRIEMDLRKKETISVYDNVIPLLGRSSLKLRSSYACGRRGRYALRDIKISTVYPLGLFHVWAWFDISAEYIVYPAPAGDRPLPTNGVGEENRGPFASRGGEDFHGHRRYERGDSPRHIDWKARARGRPLMVKEFTEGTPSAILIDWFALEGHDTETRLSQLAAWVEEAKRRKLPFALRLPRFDRGVGLGHVHASRCLEALAVYGQQAQEHKKSRQNEQKTKALGWRRRIRSGTRICRSFWC